MKKYILIGLVGLAVGFCYSYFFNNDNDEISKLEKQNKLLMSENNSLKKNINESDIRIQTLNVSIDSIRKERSETEVRYVQVPIYIDSLKKLTSDKIASIVDSTFESTSELYNPDSQYVATSPYVFNNKQVYLVDPIIPIDYLAKTRRLEIIKSAVNQCDGENRLLGYKIKEYETQKEDYNKIVSNYGIIVINKDAIITKEKNKNRLYQSLFYSTAVTSTMLILKTNQSVALLSGAATGLVTYTFKFQIFK